MFIADGHCDTCTKWEGNAIWQNSGPLDLKRVAALKALQFMAIFIPPETPDKLTQALIYLEKLLQVLELHQDSLQIVTKAQHLEADCGKVVLAIEGVDMLHGQLEVLSVLQRLGVRSVGLTWNNDNAAAGGCALGQTGLSDFGRALIKQLNQLGMVLDLAHLSPLAFAEAVILNDKPTLVSHTACAGVYTPDAPCQYRNITDAHLRLLGQKNGVCCITFVPFFLAAAKPDIATVAEHIYHGVSVAGIDAMAIGSDFDGFEPDLPGLERIELVATLAEYLIKLGFNELQIAKIMGGNLNRVLQANLLNT